MKAVRILLVIIVVAVGVYFFLGKTSYTNLPPTTTGDWIAYGDSLTAGTGAGEGNDYPAQLAQLLGRTIHNFGVPGNTTRDGLNRIDAALQRQPRVVLLCLGGNDGLRHLSMDEAFANLSAMIDSFQATGSFVVLIGVQSPSFRDKNSSRFQELAKEKGAFYIPNILDGVIGRPSLMSDYIHPNDAGYKAIAERIAGELQPVLGKL